MALFEELPGAAAVREGAERAWRLPLGAASPLWAAFGAAASLGVAYWWLTRWRKAVNLEGWGALGAAAAPVRVEIRSEPEPAPAAADLEPAAADLPLAARAAADDLTRMVGIGPKLAEALAARGVTRFAQIAAWTEADLAEVNAALALKGRAGRDAWVEQAKRLAKAG
ncbi:MAG TPA: helix-hairpin-helix domain-containing protein [Caulobacteraceae bacterium]|nr:helix-hairpin-helix domain-containing protein [Caulobacteraceae bacterium]